MITPLFSIIQRLEASLAAKSGLQKSASCSFCLYFLLQPPSLSPIYPQSSTLRISGRVKSRIRRLIPTLSGTLKACPVLLISSCPAASFRHIASFSYDRTSSTSSASAKNLERIGSRVKDLKRIRRLPLTAAPSTLRNGFKKPVSLAALQYRLAYIEYITYLGYYCLLASKILSLVISPKFGAPR